MLLTPYNQIFKFSIHNYHTHSKEHDIVICPFMKHAYRHRVSCNMLQWLQDTHPVIFPFVTITICSSSVIIEKKKNI